MPDCIGAPGATGRLPWLPNTASALDTARFGDDRRRIGSLSSFQRWVASTGGLRLLRAGLEWRSGPQSLWGSIGVLKEREAQSGIRASLLCSTLYTYACSRSGFTICSRVPSSENHVSATVDSMPKIPGGLNGYSSPRIWHIATASFFFVGGSPHVYGLNSLLKSTFDADQSLLGKVTLFCLISGVVTTVIGWCAEDAREKRQKDVAEERLRSDIREHESRINSQWEAKLEQAADLDGAVSVIRSLLMACKKSERNDPSLRVCIFEVDHANQQMNLTTTVAGPAVSEQEMEFLRCHSWTIGIAGNVARFKKKALVRFDATKLKTSPSLAEYLVQFWGFSEPDVHHMCLGRKEWCAVPVVHPNDPSQVRAVLYADSAVVGFFGKSDCHRQRILLDSAPGIAEKLDKRYDLPSPSKPLVVVGSAAASPVSQARLSSN